MVIKDTSISGLKLIEQFRAEDARGVFVKTFHQASFIHAGIDFELRESFYSISNEHVIRGMHFQHPPHDHAKIVFCTQGAILDVALDIRTTSPTYGQYLTQELSADNHLAFYIPKGFAHGFKSLTPDALTFYLVSSENVKSADDGIRYDSFGLDWKIDAPILSERDLAFPSFKEFQSPF